ncbi:MAG: hypothetical protein JHC95_04100 [Solirubrobacteraceae bacterium]|nr:hypothetical protein [Solirubrobacteraceae bacterium]
MRLVRFWLPVIVCLAGIAAVALTRHEDGIEGGLLIVSAGLSIWLLNLLFRVGVQGDRERDDEQRAREYFDQHGHWPDERPRR